MSAFEKVSAAAVDVRPIRSATQFLDLQRRFYLTDPHYVPPLTYGEAWQIDRRKNPYLGHAEAEFFAAFRGGKVVGRVSAARDRLHDEFHGDRVGFFGHFEATDAAVAQQLLDTAAGWCKQRNASQLRGPIDLSTNYRCGLLVDGTAGPPVMMMPHNRPEYGAWIEAAGLRKAKDLLALHVTSSSLDLPRVDRIVERMRRKSDARLRRLDLKDFDREMAIVWDLYHRIWERNWGFVPMTRAEFDAQARDLKRIAHPALMHIAEVAGAPAGFVVALPDVNVAIKKCGGRLLPLGWWKLLRALRTIRTVRVITLGVVPEQRKKGIETLLMHAVISQGIAAGFNACEASWILEDNHDMLGPLQTLGHVPYRRYRVYEKSLH